MATFRIRSTADKAEVRLANGVSEGGESGEKFGTTIQNIYKEPKKKQASPVAVPPVASKSSWLSYLNPFSFLSTKKQMTEPLLKKTQGEEGVNRPKRNRPTPIKNVEKKKVEMAWVNKAPRPGPGVKPIAELDKNTEKQAEQLTLKVNKETNKNSLDTQLSERRRQSLENIMLNSKHSRNKHNADVQVQMG